MVRSPSCAAGCPQEPAAEGAPGRRLDVKLGPNVTVLAAQAEPASPLQDPIRLRRLQVADKRRIGRRQSEGADQCNPRVESRGMGAFGPCDLAYDAEAVFLARETELHGKAVRGQSAEPPSDFRPARFLERREAASQHIDHAVRRPAAAQPCVAQRRARSTLSRSVAHQNNRPLSRHKIALILLAVDADRRDPILELRLGPIEHRDMASGWAACCRAARYNVF